MHHRLYPRVSVTGDTPSPDTSRDLVKEMLNRQTLLIKITPWARR